MGTLSGEEILFLTLCSLLNRSRFFPLIPLLSERPKLKRVLAVLSAKGLRVDPILERLFHPRKQTETGKHNFIIMWKNMEVYPKGTRGVSQSHANNNNYLVLKKESWTR